MDRKVSLFFAVTTCVFVAATGCAEKSESVSHLRIAPKIMSRVTGLHFDSGDQIGLTVTRASGPFVENRMMTFDGQTFASDGLMWYNDLNETSTLTAYYPFSASGVPSVFRVATDQTAGTVSSDLLVAVKSGVTPAAAPVGMLFRHKMSQLSILIDNTSSSLVSDVTLSGLVTQAAIDFEAGTVAPVSEAAAEDIRACEMTPNATYRAVVVPQTASLTVTVYTKDGKNRSKTIPSAQMASGMRYDLSVDVTDIDIDLSMSGDIEDWQNGGSLEGGSNGGNSGDDGSLVYEGETYRTATIDGRVWMAENLRYTPADAVLEEGVWYPVGGVASVASQGMLYNYETATGNTVTRSGRIRGICPEGWHIPDSAELASLKESTERDPDFFCCGGYWIALTSKYGAANKGYLLGTELTESGQCNCLMYTTGTGGQATVVQFSSENGLSVRCVRDV